MARARRGGRTHVKIVEITYRYDATDALARPRPADADAARERLDAGSRTIAALLDSLTEGTGTARRVIPVDRAISGSRPGRHGAAQRPYAAVLGCSDARVPIELIFNEGPNDLFVVRVAGNGLGSEVLGSLKYAVDHLGGSLKLIVVLGHSGCGAVSAAVDVSSTRRTISRSPASTRCAISSIGCSWSSTRRRSGWRRSTGPRSRSAGLSGGADRGGGGLERGACGLHGAAGDRRAGSAGLRAAYGVYLLANRQVWAPRAGSAECSGLAYPPADPAAFEHSPTRWWHRTGSWRSWRRARSRNGGASARPHPCRTERIHRGERQRRRR